MRDHAEGRRLGFIDLNRATSSQRIRGMRWNADRPWEAFMKRCWFIGVVVLAASIPGLGAGGGANPAKEGDAFFASKEVIHIAIEIDKKDMESLRKDQRTYVKATLTENGKVVYKNIGIHVKGTAGSVRPIDDKP